MSWPNLPELHNDALNILYHMKDNLHQDIKIKEYIKSAFKYNIIRWQSDASTNGSQRQDLQVRKMCEKLALNNLRKKRQIITSRPC